MRLSIVTALAGIIVVLMALVVGCSSKQTTTSPTITYGELNDPEFVLVKVQVDSVLTNIVSNVLSGLNNLSVAPGDTNSVQILMSPPSIEPEPDANPDSLLAVYVGDWNYVYATYTGSSYFSRLRDSIQYKDGGVVQKSPSGTVDYIHNITNWTFTALDQSTSHSDYLGRLDFELGSLDQSIATINGSYLTIIKNVYVGFDSSFTEIYSFDIDATGFRVSRTSGEWASGCPTAGTLTIDLDYIYSWENNIAFGSGNSSWTATANFLNGTATVTLSDGTTLWQYMVATCTILE